jgi:hypothetical protein
MATGFPEGVFSERERLLDRIRRAFDRMQQDPDLSGRIRGRDAKIGIFIQDLNLGWGVEIAAGALCWHDRFPYDIPDRTFFRNADDFHRFATGTPPLLLVLRRRMRRQGSPAALRLIRRSLVRAYSDLRDSR